MSTHCSGPQRRMIQLRGLPVETSYSMMGVGKGRQAPRGKGDVCACPVPGTILHVMLIQNARLPQNSSQGRRRETLSSEDLA